MKRALIVAAVLTVLLAACAPVLALADLASSPAASATQVRPGLGPASVDVNATAWATAIPLVPLQAYLGSENHPEKCEGYDWAVVAGIQRRETDHARFGGATIAPNGDVRPRIRNADSGAMGPAQIMPSTHPLLLPYDGNGDGISDPDNEFDAVIGTMKHLCGTHGDLLGPHLRSAIVSYYGADVDGYADDVLQWIDFYRARAVPLTIAPDGSIGTSSETRFVSGGGRLAEPAASRWEKLYAAARADGIELVISSSWRSSDHQAQLRWNNGCPDLTSPSSTCTIVPTAPVGSSNHEKGFAVDVANLGGSLAWMGRRACEFGFYGYGTGGRCGPASADDPWHYSIDGR